MTFEFSTAQRIVFGPGKAAEIVPAAAALGRSVLLVAGREGRRAEEVHRGLKQAGLSVTVFPVAGEPTVAMAAEAAGLARAAGAEVVVGLGGGSVIDAAKAVAALAANPGDPLEFLEVIGRGQPLRHPPLPCIAAPTTAGTGSEVTRNAVLGVPEQQVKVSLRDPRMLPRLAVIDPELTYSCPRDLTAAAGLDALTQLIEPFVSPQANPFTDALCREGIARAARALPRAYRDGNDAAAREDMALASLFGGLALANAKLGAVHGLAAPLGGMFPAPHGVICARLLAPVIAANLEALRSRAPHSAALDRYREVAGLLTGNSAARAEDGVAFLAALAGEMEIPPLSLFGLRPTDFPALVARAQRASSMRGNPIALFDAELTALLTAAL